jgi:PPOX class probable FMN-dependent enzyme
VHAGEGSIVVIDLSRNLVATLEELERLYEAPGWVAFAGETDRIIPSYRTLIEASPYITIATSGADGAQCSPRGDTPGFVRIHNERTLLIPDRAGNNRIESLRNIVHDPRIAVHFLIPGCGETLRVKGRAGLSADPALTSTFAINGKPARTVIIVAVDRVYFHCAKSILRSKLWDTTQRMERKRLPGANAMMAAVQWQRARRSFGPRGTKPPALP